MEAWDTAGFRFDFLPTTDRIGNQIHAARSCAGGVTNTAPGLAGKFNIQGFRVARPTK